MREDIQSVLYSPETLAEKVRQMGQRISQDYAGKIRFWSVCSKARSYS